MAFDRIDPRIARDWRAWYSGPREIQLDCAGGTVAKTAYEAYRHWPIARGRTRLERMLRCASGGIEQFRNVPFRTQSGARVYMDLGSTQFCELCGVAPTEPFELSVMCRLVRPGDTFVDVGAHLGLYAIHVSGLVGDHGRCIAVEPDSGNVCALRACMRECRNVEIVQAAASDKAGRGRLLGAGELDGHLTEGEEGADVDLIRLDDAIPCDGSRGTCVVKIDVERHETRVLRGLTGWLAQGTRPLLQIEYLPDDPPSHIGHRAELQSVFAEELAGYRFFAMCPEHGCCHPFVPGDQVEATVLNVLACPVELLDRVMAATVVR